MPPPLDVLQIAAELRRMQARCGELAQMLEIQTGGRPRNADPFGFRRGAQQAYSYVRWGPGDEHALEIPAYWAKRKLEEGNDAKHLAEFFGWLRQELNLHGLDDGGRRLQWLDTMLNRFTVDLRLAPASKPFTVEQVDVVDGATAREILRRGRR